MTFLDGFREAIREQQLPMQEQLQRIANDHAEKSGGLLVALPVDQEKYPGQSIFDTKMEGTPINDAAADSIAESLVPRYGPLRQELGRLASSGHVGFTQIAEDLRASTNVVNGTDHSELMDIALWHLAFSNELRMRGLLFKSGIVTSKMVDFLALRGEHADTPLRDILTLGFDSVYLPIPRSISTHGKFDKYALRVYNGKVKKDIEADMNRRPRSNRVPVFLAVAMPGTINKPLDTSQPQYSEYPEETMVVGQIQDGVLSYTSLPSTFTYASSVRIAEKGSDIFLADIGHHLQTHDDIVGFGQELILGISTLDNRPHIYDADGQTPVIRAQ